MTESITTDTMTETNFYLRSPEGDLMCFERNDDGSGMWIHQVFPDGEANMWECFLLKDARNMWQALRKQGWEREYISHKVSLKGL